MATKQPKPKSTTPASKKDAPRLISDNTKLMVTVPWEHFAVEYDRALNQSAKQVKLKGFRKGKAPKKVAEVELNKEQLIDKALQAVMPPLYQELIAKEKKQPLTNPEFNPVSMDWGKDWVFEVFIAEKPEISLGDYKKIIKTANKQAVEEIKKLEKDHEQEHAKDGHVHSHDQEEARNREVKLHYLFRELVQAVKPQIPELLLKEESRHKLGELVNELQQMKLTLDNYLERKKQTFQELSQEIAAQTLGQIQLGFILDALEKAEKLDATQADIAKELDTVKDEKLRTQMASDPRYTEYVTSQIRRRKLIDWMISL